MGWDFADSSGGRKSVEGLTNLRPIRLNDESAPKIAVLGLSGGSVGGIQL